MAARGKKGGFFPWMKAQFSKRPMPLPLVIAGDILLLGVALVVFSLFHHVIPSRMEAIGTVSTRGGAMAPASATATVSPEAVQTPDPALEGDSPAAPQEAVPPEATALVGDFSQIYQDKFSAGEPELREENGAYLYQSPNIYLTFQKHEADSLVYYVADFYIRDISLFKTALAKDTYGVGFREDTPEIARNNNALIAINGDYYGARKEGVVIRNGVLYRDTPFRDVCVLYWDGTMETYRNVDFNANDAMEKGAYQAWCFGPELLDQEGQPMTDFNSSVTGRHPRTAIGYFAPGHYCFVVADGRTSVSRGLSMEALSQLMADLGCVRAYNLDGGQTSVMAWNGQVVNNPAGGGRQCSDIVMITEG